MEPQKASSEVMNSFNYLLSILHCQHKHFLECSHCFKVHFDVNELHSDYCKEGEGLNSDVNVATKIYHNILREKGLL